MEKFTLRVDSQGRIALPSWWRKEQSVSPASELHVTQNAEGGLVIETREQGLRRARALVRKYIPEGEMLSEDLLADRRREAEREWQR
jgi:bifunctional DNA-binding transcriptional regulator/antitoxin component of YhaV-PrlF toxin-antitoxin module